MKVTPPLDEEEEFNGADLSIHKIRANPESDLSATGK